MAEVENITRRERRKQEVRNRINEAGIQVFSEKLLEEVTVDEICEQADVARKTFYNYYPSKLDLMEYISQTLLIAQSMENFSYALKNYASTLQRINFFLTHLGDSLAKSEMLERNMIMQAMLDLSDNTGRSREKLESTNVLYEKLFIEGRKIGDVNDDYSARFLAEMVAGSINSTVINWIHNPDFPLKRRIKELKRFVIDIAIKKS